MRVSAKHFRDNSRGSVTIMFGLTVLMVLGLTGIAVDYSRTTAYQSRVQAALDSAVLSATKAMVEKGASNSEVEQIAKAYFEQAMGSLAGMQTDHAGPKFTIDRTAGTVTMSLTGGVETTIARLLGKNRLDLEVISTAEYGTKDIELAVMLDVSGSMGGDKLTTLKQAGNDLFDLLLDNNPAGRKVRIGLAPYSTSINAGDYSAKAKGNSGQGNANSNKCISERKGNDAFTDEPPSNGKQFGGKPVECPVNTVLAMTDDKATLADSINGYVAQGMTAGHLGIAWAWYLVSPKWKDFWPDDSAPEDYDPKKLVKSVVIMTDGMFNIEYEPDNGASAAQGLALCENIKSEGITVFTVGFQAPAEVKPLLEACASQPEYAFDATDSAALKKSFEDIGNTLNDLRLAK